MHTLRKAVSGCDTTSNQCWWKSFHQFKTMKVKIILSLFVNLTALCLFISCSSLCLHRHHYPLFTHCMVKLQLAFRASTHICGIRVESKFCHLVSVLNTHIMVSCWHYACCDNSKQSFKLSVNTFHTTTIFKSSKEYAFKYPLIRSVNKHYNVAQLPCKCILQLLVSSSH